MNTLVLILITAALLFIIWKKFMPVKGIETISTEEAEKKSKNKNVQCIDVRTVQEFQANNKRRFKNIPLSEISSRSGELNKEKEVVLLCRSGMRSKSAAVVLKKQGFTKVSNVRGGIIQWR